MTTVTSKQLLLLKLAIENGGRVSSRQSIEARLGPATPGLLANKGLLEDLGLQDGTQWYCLTPEAAQIVKAADQKL